MAAAKPFRPALLAGLLAAGALALGGCHQTPSAGRAPEHGDQAVARVDGRTVWASDVKREAVAQGLIGEGEPLDVSSDAFRRMLDEVVDQKLLAAEAIKRKLDKDPAVQRRLDAARDRVLGDALVETVVADAASEPAIRGLYQEQLKLANRSEQIHARQIVLATAAEASQVKALLASGAAFEPLAIQRSIDAATKFNGGDLGYFTADVMPDAYGAALKDARAGQIVGPFPVAGGYAVVKIEDRRPEPPIALDAARPQIVRFLTYDQIRDLLEKLRSRSKVQVLIKTEGAPPPPADAPKAPQPQTQGVRP